MVPQSERATDERLTDGGSPSASGEGATGDDVLAGIDEQALFVVVRDAVKDAILDVIGTLLLVGVALVLVVTGAGGVLQSSSPTGTAVGLVLVVVGLSVAATSLELVPPVREWV